MFIELGKQVKASEEMKPAIQKRMYAFAAEMPHNIEVTNKEDKYELSFGSLDKTVEIIFGKQWVKETEEIPEHFVKVPFWWHTMRILITAS